MKIAGHTLGTPGMSLENALRLFKASGLEAAEIIWQDDYPAAIPEMANEADLRQINGLAHEIELEIACLTPYMTAINSLEEVERERDIQRFTRCIKAARQLDCRYIRVYAGSFMVGEDAERAEKWQRLVEALKNLGNLAEQSGVILCVENHFNTMAITAAETVALMEAVSSPGVGILYDQANLTFTYGESYQEAIDLQKPWISHVHVKDLIFTEPGKAFVAGSVARVEKEARAVRSRVVGEGIMDWPAILTYLVTAGSYDGFLSLEYEYRWHPDDLPEPEQGFRRGAEHIRGILRKTEKKEP